VIGIRVGVQLERLGRNLGKNFLLVATSVKFWVTAMLFLISLLIFHIVCMNISIDVHY